MYPCSKLPIKRKTPDQSRSMNAKMLPSPHTLLYAPPYPSQLATLSEKTHVRIYVRKKQQQARQHSAHNLAPNAPFVPEKGGLGCNRRAPNLCIVCSAAGRCGRMTRHGRLPVCRPHSTLLQHFQTGSYLRHGTTAEGAREELGCWSTLITRSRCWVNIRGRCTNAKAIPVTRHVSPPAW